MPRAPKTSKTNAPRLVTEEPGRDSFYWPREKIEGLISEASSRDNVRTLLGKQEPGENTSGDTKAKVYDRIAAKLYPTEFRANPKVWRKRIQHKWAYLGTQYRNAAKRLRRTGEGLKLESEVDKSDILGDGIREIELQHYIPPSGPDHDTPEAAKNIWQDIISKFPQFPRMHELLSTRPNQVPIAVTTALTPSGPTTIFHQPPSDSEDEGVDTPIAPPFTPEFNGTMDLALPLVTRGRRAAQPSNQLRMANKASNSVLGAGLHRQGIEERFLEIQKQIQARIFHRDQHAQQLAARQQLLQEKQHLLEEFKLGLITQEQYRSTVARLEGGGLDSTVDIEGSSQVSHPGTSNNSIFLSPEWTSSLILDSQSTT